MGKIKQVKAKPERRNSFTSLSSATSYESSIASTGTNQTDESLENFKDLTKNMAYVLTRKYSAFKERPSLLDDCSKNSMLNKSGIKGLHNLCQMFGFITIITYPLIRYRKMGSFLNESLIENFTKDFLLCLMSWPLFYFWSYTALLLQKAIAQNWVQTKTAIFIHILIILFPFIYTMYMVLTFWWCASHSGYISMLACTHTMKMHSYFVINYEYRKDTEQSKKNNETPLSPYPHNLTFWNFTVYMWMPVLVYEYEYPRSQKFRLKFLIWKISQTACGIMIGYMLITDYMLPYIEMGDKISALELLCRLIIPSCAFFMNIFYIIWEGFCNVFAEITQFGDRKFYDDWWNSTTYEEFNRKWNKCVYHFLFRHVYLECRFRYKLNKKKAQIITFLVSAILHEWILVLVFKITRPIMTAFILQQIPLFFLTKHLYKTKQGNMLVWFGLILGIPLIGVCYLRCDPFVTELFYFERNSQIAK